MTRQTDFAIPEPHDASGVDTAASTEVLPASAPAQAPAQNARPAPAAAPVDAAPPASASAPIMRTLGTGAIIAIAVGGVLAAGLFFGGGIAVGLAIPGGGVPTSSQGGGPNGVPNGGPGGDSAPGGGGTDRGARPEAPGGGTNQERPTAPNPDDTGTGDSAEEG